MSEHGEGIDQNDLDKLLISLQSLLREFPKVMQEVRVIVDVPETSQAAAESNMLEATKAERCPGCPPGRCRLDGITLQWFCD